MSVAGPILPPRPMAQLYSNAMFQTWGNQSRRLWEQERRLITHHFSNRSLRILNVGCGAGRETFSLYELGYMDVTGVDCTESLVDLARQRAVELGSSATFVCGDATALPFPDEDFDLITILENVYGHFTPRSMRVAALKDASRCLKPGGSVVIEAISLMDHYRYYLAIRLMELGRCMYNPHRLGRGDKLMKDARSLKDLPPDKLPRSHWFRPGEIESEARDAGLDVTFASTVQGVLNDHSRPSRKTHHQGRFMHILKLPDRS